MTDRDSPVTEEELHAYVDGELPADREEAVAAWLAAYPEQAALVAAWRTQADNIRARYGAVARDPVPEWLKLDQVIKRDRSNGRSWAAMATAAAVIAFMVGGSAGWIARGAATAAPAGFDTVTADALIVVEEATKSRFAAPEEFTELERRRYDDTEFVFLHSASLD